VTRAARRLARLAILLAAVGCGPSDAPTPPGAPPPGAGPVPSATPPPAPTPAAPAADASAAAAEVFATRCAVCHGAEGRGDGPGGAALDPKPRDFHDPAWRSASTEDGVRRVILEGGPALGKSAAMVGHPDLAARPDVLAALVARVRSFGR
jgi:mono/diheme cytochrome c family protein